MAMLPFSSLMYFTPQYYLAFLSFAVAVFSFYTKTAVVLQSKQKEEAKTKKNKGVSISALDLRISVCCVIAFVLTTRASTTSGFISSNFIVRAENLKKEVLLYLLVLMLFSLFIFFYKKPRLVNDYQVSFLLPLVATVHCLLSSTNLVSFTFIIEVMSYLFYFQFLAVHTKKNYTKKSRSLLDLILFYYWSSFISSVCMVYANVLMLTYFNTTSFTEVGLLIRASTAPDFIYFFIFLAFTLKFGVLGFHLFKAELYKYLYLDGVFNYSIFSVIAYVLVLQFLFSSLPGLSEILMYRYIFVFVCFSLFIFFGALTNMDNLMLFFGYSGVLTSTVCFFGLL